MKLKIYIAFLSFTVLLSAGCKKEITIKNVEFDAVSVKLNGTPTTEFILGDTIGFNFTGNPDIITFYSGKPGGRYEFRDRTEAAGTPLLSFTSSLTQKNNNLPNSLSLLISADFKGIVNVTKWSLKVRDTLATANHIREATWADLSAKATFSPGVNANYIASGAIDLKEFAGKPVYIAFKYAAPAGEIQPKWAIRDFLVTNKLDDGTEYVIANMQLPTSPFTNYGVTSYSPGWALATDRAMSASVGWTLTSAAPFTLDVAGTASAAANAKNGETWAIIGPINLKKVSADKGVVVKTIANRVQRYVIPKADNYTVKGTYKTVFEATNSNTDQSQSKIKNLELVIN